MQRDERHLVGEHVVHLPGDAGALAEPWPARRAAPVRPRPARRARATTRPGRAARRRRRRRRRRVRPVITPDDTSLGQLSRAPDGRVDGEARPPRPPSWRPGRGRVAGSASEKQADHQDHREPCRGQGGDAGEGHQHGVGAPPPQGDGTGGSGDQDHDGRRRLRSRRAKVSATVANSDTTTNTTSRARGPIRSQRAVAPFHVAMGVTLGTALRRDDRRTADDRGPPQRLSSDLAADRRPMPAGRGARRSWCP